VIIVTGGSRGQGAAKVRRLVSDGARVIFGDVLEDEGLPPAKELGDKAEFHPHDVTKEDYWLALLDLAERAGGLTDLVNNAGIFRPKPILETDQDDFQAHFQIN
jgi:3alpha(or 20beta)-hydroxysteroid dehydrogenase